MARAGRGSKRPGAAGSGLWGTSSRAIAKSSSSPAAGPPGRLNPVARAAESTKRTSRHARMRASAVICPRLLIRKPVEERLHAGAPQLPPHLAALVGPAQALCQARHTAQIVAHRQVLPAGPVAAPGEDPRLTIDRRSSAATAGPGLNSS
jgi:hypothetical protein